MPASPHTRKALAVAGSVLAGALLPLGFFLLTARQPPSDGWGISFLICLSFSVAIAIPAWIVMPRVGRLHARLPMPWNWLLTIAAMVLIAAGGSAVALAPWFLSGYYDAGFYWPSYVRSLRMAVFISLTIGLGAFTVELLRHKLNAAREEAERRRREAEEHRRLAAEAQLASLESRVHPHFLFNTLNTLAALIREDPAAAERLVERLAALLRFSLDASDVSLAPLRLELRLVEDYLEIERMRFGDRLRYEIDVPEELRDCPVPPMAVQTLVENAVKYAVAPRRDGGTIRVTGAVRDGTVELAVSDDGPGFEESALVKGHGLDLLQSRLAIQFGNRAALELRREGGSTVVVVLLPAVVAESR